MFAFRTGVQGIADDLCQSIFDLLTIAYCIYFLTWQIVNFCVFCFYNQYNVLLCTFCVQFVFAFCVHYSGGINLCNRLAILHDRYIIAISLYKLRTW